MNNLRLFIVAGPNGSGKSLFSSKLTESDYTVFGGDKHLTEFAKKYPETGSDVLSYAVNEQVFKVEKLKAIAERKSYEIKPLIARLKAFIFYYGFEPHIPFIQESMLSLFRTSKFTDLPKKILPEVKNNVE